MAEQADVSLAPTTQATTADISPAEPITQAAPVPTPAPAADGHSPGQPNPIAAAKQDGDGAGEGISAKNKGLDLAGLNGLLEATRNDPRHRAAEAVASGMPLPPTPPAATPTPPAPTAAEDDADDIAPPAPGPDGRLPQMKIRPQSGLDQTVISLAKQQGKSVTDLAVINAARLLHNLPPLAEAGTGTPPATPEGTTPAAPAAQTPNSDPASALAELDTEIARVKAARLEAKNDFDFDAEAEAEERLEQLREQRTNLVIESRTQSGTTQNATEQAFAEANAAAMKRYADLANDNSPLTVRARALQQQAVDANDPFAWDPRSILHFANEAAAELGIAPASAAPARTPSPAPSARPPLSIVSGGSPQSPPNRANTDTNPRLESPADYEALMARLTGVNYGGSRRPVHA